MGPNACIASPLPPDLSTPDFSLLGIQPAVGVTFPKSCCRHGLSTVALDLRTWSFPPLLPLKGCSTWPVVEHATQATRLSVQGYRHGVSWLPDSCHAAPQLSGMIDKQFGRTAGALPKVQTVPSALSHVGSPLPCVWDAGCEHD